MKTIDYKKRMYAGYPIFLLTYFDEANNRYNYSTLSSMYTLGKMAVLGLGNNNSKKCITEHKTFTVSFVTLDYTEDINNGAKPGLEFDKFKTSNLTLIKKDGYAYIKEAQLVYKLTLKEVFVAQSFKDYTNVFCNIDTVLVNNQIYLNGSIDVCKYQPSIFIGTDNGRFYKTIK